MTRSETAFKPEMGKKERKRKKSGKVFKVGELMLEKERENHRNRRKKNWLKGIKQRKG